jgi:hypothetical protein
MKTMKMSPKRKALGASEWKTLFLVCALAMWASVQLGCTADPSSEDNAGDDDNDDNDDNDNSGDDDDDNDDSSGDGDADSDGDADICEDYPDADDDFGKGSVISNYTLLDKDDKESEICELSDGAKLLLIKLTCML